MGKKHIEQNKTIAEQLGISYEMVEYIRPRLLGASYKENIPQLIESIKKHKQNAQETNPRAKAALEKNQRLLARPNDPHKEIHEKRIKHHTEALSGLMRNIPLYDSMITFLENISPQQKEVLLKV